MKKKIIFITISLVLLLAAFAAWNFFWPTLSNKDNKYIYIKTGATYANVKEELLNKKIVGTTFWFNLIAKRLNYDDAVKPGRYEITSGMSIYNLLKNLRNGKQAPVKLVINKLRTKEDLAQKIAANFECDSLSIINFLNNNDSLAKFNLDTNTAMTAIIPNTYNVLWNTSAAKIFKKLYDEQEKFWTEERRRKAAALQLIPQQVYTMASIVEEETNKQEDKGKIASVYINRIASNQKLEADPTVKFAMKDFGLKRIYQKHLSYPSPYNTYQHTGLPPGPICTPSPNTIDAVLNAPATDYIFFVAKPDFNGYSNFASTYKEHLVFAKAYQQALDSLMKAKAEKGHNKNKQPFDLN
jgi:UPF0755 protein